MLFSIISTRLPTPIASAPPEPPSPITVEITGTVSRLITSRLTAIASDWPALLGADARVGARGVDEREHRAVEAIGELEQPARLAVALGARHPEVPHHVLFGVPALLVAHHQHRLPVEPREAGDDRGVLAERPVARELEEVGEQVVHVVEEVRPRVVPRQLHHLPAREIAEDLLLQLLRLLLELADLGGEVDASRSRRGPSAPRSSSRARAAAARTPTRSSSRLPSVFGVSTRQRAIQRIDASSLTRRAREEQP